MNDVNNEVKTQPQRVTSQTPETSPDMMEVGASGPNVGGTVQHPDRITGYLSFCCFIFIIGSSFLYGYNVGDLNTPARIINESFYMRIYANRTGKTVNDKSVADLTVALWQLTIALFVAGGAVGSFGSSFICERVGRRGGNMINQFPAILSGVFSFTAKYTDIPELLMIGRFFAGLTAGAGCTYVPVYLTEIAPTKYRGAIATTHQLSITVGIVIAQILSLPDIWGNEDWWGILVGFNMVPAVLSLILLPLCVESPRFLFIIRRDEDRARTALQRLRRRKDVEDDLEEMRREKKKKDEDIGKPYTIKDLFREKENKIPLLATISMQILQQWSGINAVMFYSSLIFTDAGVSNEDVPFAVMGTGLVNVATTIVAVFVIEKAGRRKLILIPCLIIAIIYLILTGCLAAKEKLHSNVMDIRNDYKTMVPLNKSVNDLENYLFYNQNRSRHDYDELVSNMNTQYVLSIIVIIGIMIYIISFAIGLGPIPMYISAELFRQAPRAAASSIAQVVNWTCNLLLSLTFIYLKDALGPYIFLPFMFIVITIGFFVFIRIPETKGRTFQETVEFLMSGRVAYRPTKKINLNEKEASNGDYVTETQLLA